MNPARTIYLKVKPSTQAAAACALLAGLLLLAAGCAKKSAPNVLARVGDQVITVDDFEAEVQYRVANRQPIPERLALLEQMVTRLTLVQQAKADGLENATDVRRNFEDMLIARLQENKLEPQLVAVKVSPDEIKAAYVRDAARFTQPAKVHLAIIFLAADAKWSTNRLAEMAARARQARQQARALPASEKGFGSVAADFSADQITRYRGGDAGWFTTNLFAARWPSAVLTAGLALASDGDVSEIIQAADGFYLAKRMDARPSVVQPLEQVQGGIERRLLAAKRTEIEQAFRRSLRAGKVQTDLPLLTTVAYPTQALSVATRPPSLPGSP